MRLRVFSGIDVPVFTPGEKGFPGRIEDLVGSGWLFFLSGR